MNSNAYFDNPFLNLGIGLLSQPTMGQGLLQGTNLARQAQLQGLQNKLMGQQFNMGDLQMQQAQQQIQQGQARQQLGGLLMNGPSNAPMGSQMGPPTPGDASQRYQWQLQGLLAQVAPEQFTTGLLSQPKTESSKWQDFGDTFMELDATGNPTGRSIPKGVLKDPSKEAERTFTIESKLADDYNAQTKDFKSVNDAYKRVKTALKDADKSAASTLAAGTSFMKMLDPGSVVRETELGMALAATGAFDRAMNYYNVLQTGKVLTTDQKADFMKISDEIYRAAVSAQKEVDTAYTERANRYNVNPDNVILKRDTKTISGLLDNRPPIESILGK